MQIKIKNSTLCITLTKTEQRQLQAAADICDGIAHVSPDPSAGIAAELRSYALTDHISHSNGKSDDDLAASDAAETVLEQSPALEKV